MCAYRHAPFRLLVPSWRRHACVCVSTQRALYSCLHLPPPTPPGPLLPQAAFLFIFARSSRVFLKLFGSVEIHQARRRENNGGAQVNREWRSRQRKQWSLNYWVPSFSITSHVPGLMACFFLLFFILAPFGNVVDRWENITHFLFGKKKKKKTGQDYGKAAKNEAKTIISSTSHCHISC